MFPTNLNFCRIGKLARLYPLPFIFLLSFWKPAPASRPTGPAVPGAWDSLVGKIRERDTLYLGWIEKLKNSLRTPWIEQITKDGRLQQVIDSQKFLVEQEAGLQKVLDHLDQLKNSRNVTYGVLLLRDTTQISETVYDTVSRVERSMRATDGLTRLRSASIFTPAPIACQGPTNAFRTNP